MLKYIILNIVNAVIIVYFRSYGSAEETNLSNSAFSSSWIFNQLQKKVLMVMSVKLLQGSIAWK